MKNIKQLLRKNYKLYIGIIMGIVVSSISVYAATTINSNDVSYSNTNSGLNSSNVQGAIDEVANKADIRNRGNFISAYTYNQTLGASNYCITGEEDTCQKTECYKRNSGSCKAGDIIKYKVNEANIVTFHVMFDNGSTLTMQSQRNIVDGVAYITKKDYDTVVEEGFESDTPMSIYGPLTALESLQRVTNNWSNLNRLYYELESASYNTEKEGYARLIKKSEISQLGSPLPIWLTNYTCDTNLVKSKWSPNRACPHSLKKIVNDIYNFGYWIDDGGYTVKEDGSLEQWDLYLENVFGVRAVVEVNKLR